MRSMIFCCALVAFAPAYANAQSLDQVISADQRMHDFGAVARSANTEHRFTLFNPFKSDLHIRSIRASCGCTTPIVETETIKPGETGTILARFNTGTFTGQKGATLTVSIDRPVFTELQLNVKGYIRSDIVVSPGEIAYGSVPVGESKTIECTLNYAGRSDWAIQEIVSPLEFVSASFEELERSAGKVSYKITAKISESAPIGFLQNQLVLRTNDRRLTSFPIRLTGTVESALQVSPQNLALGKILPGEPIQKRLVFKGKEPFRILEISSDNAEIRYDKAEEPKKAHLINIIVIPKDSPAGIEVKGDIRVKTDMDDQELKLDVSFTPDSASPKPPAEVQAAN